MNGVGNVAVDAQGIVYVANRANHRVRRIAPDGTATTFTGSKRTGSEDGPVAEATFSTPTGVAAGPRGAQGAGCRISHDGRPGGTDGAPSV